MDVIVVNNTVGGDIVVDMTPQTVNTIFNHDTYPGITFTRW